MLEQPAAAVVSGLPLLNKPLRTRVRLISEAFGLMHRHAPFVQFTYSMTTLADPQDPVAGRGRGFPADLDEPAAGAGLGLSQGAAVLTAAALRHSRRGAAGRYFLQSSPGMMRRMYSIE